MLQKLTKTVDDFQRVGLLKKQKKIKNQNDGWPREKLERGNWEIQNRNYACLIELVCKAAEASYYFSKTISTPSFGSQNTS